MYGLPLSLVSSQNSRSIHILSNIISPGNTFVKAYLFKVFSSKQTLKNRSWLKGSNWRGRQALKEYTVWCNQMGTARKNWQFISENLYSSVFVSSKGYYLVRTCLNVWFISCVLMKSVCIRASCSDLNASHCITVSLMIFYC